MRENQRHDPKEWLRLRGVAGLAMIIGGLALGVTVLGLPFLASSPFWPCVDSADGGYCTYDGAIDPVRLLMVVGGGILIVAGQRSIVSVLGDLMNPLPGPVRIEQETRT